MRHRYQHHKVAHHQYLQKGNEVMKVSELTWSSPPSTATGKHLQANESEASGMKTTIFLSVPLLYFSLQHIKIDRNLDNKIHVHQSLICYRVKLLFH